MGRKPKAAAYHVIGCLIKLLLVVLVVVVTLVLVAKFVDQIYDDRFMNDKKTLTAHVHFAVNDFGMGNVLSVCSIVLPNECEQIYEPGIEAFVKWTALGPVVLIQGDEMVYVASEGRFYPFRGD